MTKEKRVKKKGGCLKPVLITLVVFVLIIAFASAGGDDDNESNTAQINATNEVTDSQTTEATEPEADEPEYTSYKAGMYKVGTDLPAGEYLIVGEGLNYMEVSSDSSGELSSIITNENYTNRIYIAVSDGQYLKFDGTAIPVAEAPGFQAENGYYPEGQYLVGRDIPAGEYKISLTSDNVVGYGYVEVASSSVGTLDSIITNANIETDTYQTITDGQYLTLSGAEIKAQ